LDFPRAPPFVFWLAVCSGLRRSTLAALVVAFTRRLPGRCSVAIPLCFLAGLANRVAAHRPRVNASGTVVDAGFAPRSHLASRGHTRILRVREEKYVVADALQEHGESMDGVSVTAVVRRR